jgi:hypothetical protein
VYLHVDAGQVPPAVELRDPDDFTSLKAVVVTLPHLWFDEAVLTKLADRAGDEDWQAQLARMFAFAGTKGWLDDRGRVRAHVELENG